MLGTKGLVLDHRCDRKNKPEVQGHRVFTPRDRRVKDPLVQFMISSVLCTEHHFTGKFQVTNQMISACKAYITNNGTASIWNQPQDVVVEKILSAIKLKQVTTSVIIYLDNVLLFFCCFLPVHLRSFSNYNITDFFTLKKLNVNKSTPKMYSLIPSFLGLLCPDMTLNTRDGRRR